MLLDQAKATAAKIADYERLQATVDEAKQFETRSKQFSETTAGLSRAKQVLESMRNAGIEVDFIPNESSSLIEKTKSLRTGIKTSPKTLLDPPFDLKFGFTDRILGIKVAAEATVLAAWAIYVRKNNEFGSDEVLDALSAVPQYRAAVVKIRSLRSQLLALESVIPSDPKMGISQVQSIVENYRKTWNEMTAEGIPGSVIAFLRACAAEGAPLNGLTEEVRGWLESRNLLQAFRIKIR